LATENHGIIIAKIMAQFNKKKNQRKLWHSPIVLAIIFCLLVVFAYNMIGLIEKAIDTSKKKNLQVETINTLNTRQTELSARIAKLSTDEGIEESIRDKYQVAKVGESIVTIVDQQPSTIPPYSTTEKHGFWVWIKSFFHL
jgi:cell division protein FtsB